MVGIALMKLLLREYYALLLWFLSLVMVVVQLGRKGEARRVIVESVNTFPWNWEAWASLQKACENRVSAIAPHVAAMCIDAPHRPCTQWLVACVQNQALSLQLRSHWMSKFFFASVCLEFQHNLESLQR